SILFRLCSANGNRCCILPLRPRSIRPLHSKKQNSRRMLGDIPASSLCRKDELLDMSAVYLIVLSRARNPQKFVRVSGSAFSSTLSTSRLHLFRDEFLTYQRPLARYSLPHFPFLVD